MSLTKKEVVHLAKLARIELTEKEVKKFQAELSSILDYVNKLKKVDIRKIEVIFPATAGKNISRKDQVKSFNQQESLLKQAPDQQNNFYKVKAVLK